MTGTGALTAIYLRPAARHPVRIVDRVMAAEGDGLDGDHASGGSRQVTVLTEEGWAAACRDLEQDVDPRVRRANLLVRNVDLAAAIDDILILGDVVIEVLGECDPCELLDQDGRDGLCSALRPHRRAGVIGRIIRGGELRVGMPCQLTGRDRLAPDR